MEGSGCGDYDGVIADHQQWPEARLKCLKETNPGAAEQWEMGRAVLGALPLCRVASAKSHHEDYCFPKPEVCCAHHGLRQYHLTEKLFWSASLGLFLLVTY